MQFNWCSAISCTVCSNFLNRKNTCRRKYALHVTAVCFLCLITYFVRVCPPRDLKCIVLCLITYFCKVLCIYMINPFPKPKSFL
jgi:hypothetical protein